MPKRRNRSVVPSSLIAKSKIWITTKLRRSKSLMKV